MTQLELEKKLVEKDAVINALKSVVMIQCVGSREPDHLYCSRVCCTQAINNAIRMKEAIRTRISPSLSRCPRLRAA
jgi:heterodisulfide reductase subunit A